MAEPLEHQLAFDKLKADFDAFRAQYGPSGEVSTNQQNPVDLVLTVDIAVIVNPEITQQVKEIKATLARTQGDTILDFEGFCLFPEAKLLTSSRCLTLRSLMALVIQPVIFASSSIPLSP